MSENSFDVIVIGAGAAGLIAAWELVQAGRSVAIFEAKDYAGGRIHTIRDNNFDLPVEFGAEFIHGDLEVTKGLLRKAGAEPYKISGEIWQNEGEKLDEQDDFIEDYSALVKKFRKVKDDVSVAEFIDRHLQGEEFEEARFTLQNYVEGYYAGDITKASALALKEELTTSDDIQYRVEGGYVKLVEYLVAQSKTKRVQFYLSEPANKIEWVAGNVTVSSNKRMLTAQKILVTVSIGVLRSESIIFSPSVTSAIFAAKQLGFGPVIKTILQFKVPFWKDKNFTQGRNLDKLSFIFSEAVIPTWWTYHPKDSAMLTGWSGGPHAEKIQHLSSEEILEKALESLSEIFKTNVAFLRQNLKSWHVANWVNDPFTCGGYSYEVVNGNRFKRILKQPIENTIFFAGEGLFEGPEIGTVEAALQSGRETAHQIIASFRK